MRDNVSLLLYTVQLNRAMKSTFEQRVYPLKYTGGTEMSSLFLGFVRDNSWRFVELSCHVPEMSEVGSAVTYKMQS